MIKTKDHKRSIPWLRTDPLGHSERLCAVVVSDRDNAVVLYDPMPPRSMDACKHDGQAITTRVADVGANGVNVDVGAAGDVVVLVVMMVPCLVLMAVV